MKIENPNQKIEIKFPNRKIKSENENQICATLFTYTYTHTLNWLSNWQEICCHQWPNFIICRISNKANTHTLTYANTISYTHSATFA